MKKQNNILSFEKFSHVAELMHGYSTSYFGSMHPNQMTDNAQLKHFASEIHIDFSQIIRMHQVHSNTVRWVTAKDAGTTIPETDGLLTDQPGLFLGVVVGDCIPLFLYDKEKKFVGAVHAGRRGLQKEIIKSAVSEMIAKGSNPKDIIAGIGPSIRGCCYEIGQELSDQLLADFPDWKPFIITREGKIFLDPPQVAIHQLQQLGIPAENIEDADHCTFEKHDVYSYRREGASFGEIIGIIGRKA